MYRVDYHIHSDFSDGQPTYKHILDRAKQMELDCIAITDHFDDYDPHDHIRPIDDKDLLDYFQRIREYGQKVGQKVLCGIETCTDFWGNLRLSDEVMEGCDLIITSPHYIEYDHALVPGDYFHDRYWHRYKEKVLNMALGQGAILGHCEGYLPYDKLLVPGTTTYEERQELARTIVNRYFDEDYQEELIKRLKKSGKALELHCATATPRESFIEKLVYNQVPMSLGSDAHVLDAVGQTKWGVDMLQKYSAENLLFIIKDNVKDE